jgi:DNA-directed RNA polymerase beta' subunit
LISSYIYFKNKPNTLDKLYSNVNNNLKYIKLGDLILSFKINDYKKDTPKAWHIAYKLVYNDEYLKHNFSLTLKLDIKKCYDYKITLQSIANKLNSMDDVVCIFSPMDICELEIFVNTQGIDVENSKLYYITEENKEICFIIDIVLKEIKNIKISGIVGIDKIFPTKTKDGEWYIEAEGSNLSVLLSKEHIDNTRTKSDSVWEIYRILGIEAARIFIINEINNVIEHTGGYIDKRHVMLLADFICDKGIPRPVSRDGINRDVGPLSKSSFEEELKNFMEAGVMTESDDVNSVSSNIIVGKVGRIGTGLNDMIFDDNFLIRKNKEITREDTKILLIKEVNQYIGLTKEDVVKNKNKNLLYIKYNYPCNKVDLELIFGCVLKDFKVIVHNSLYCAEFDSIVNMKNALSEYHEAEIDDTVIYLYDSEMVINNYDDIM